MWDLLFIGLVVTATFAIALYGVTVARTTSDFFVATRSVGPMWNASAIAGEYLSAASFLGVAGLVLKNGSSAMWYPLGYAAGYLVLLLFVAAPLRRFGAYTIPDFAEGRFGSDSMRKLAAVIVLIIGWFYLLPQMKGAGVTLSLLTGAPYWSGVVLAAFLVTLAVTLGGMKGVTYVQAFHYWTKLIAIGVPAGILLTVVGLATTDGSPFETGPLTFPNETAISFDDDTTLHLDQPVSVVVDGQSLEWSGPTVVVDAGSRVVFPVGTPVPGAETPPPDGRSWTLPFPDRSIRSLVAAISLVVATVLGTMGLPHILVRFYTNRDGSSARRTAVGTLSLVGFFYFFPWLYAAMGRSQVPQLYTTGDTEVVVLTLPHILGGRTGEVLGALVAAGAFSAFLSTSSGLLVSVAGALAHDLAGPLVRRADDQRRMAVFRLSAAIGGLVALALGLLVEPFEINVLVGWAFAIAASAFCPLLMLGIWWPSLARDGAAWGMAVGASLSTGAILTTMLAPQTGWPGTLLAQPAIITVPLAFAVMVFVSKRRRPHLASDLLLQMHSPDRSLHAPPVHRSSAGIGGDHQRVGRQTSGEPDPLDASPDR